MLSFLSAFAMSPSQAMTTTSLSDADSPKPDTEVSSVPVRIMSSYLTAFPCFGTAYHPPRLIGPERVAFPLQLARHLYSLLVLSIKCQYFPSPISPHPAIPCSDIRKCVAKTIYTLWQTHYILSAYDLRKCPIYKCERVPYLHVAHIRHCQEDGAGNNVPR